MKRKHRSEMRAATEKRFDIHKFTDTDGQRFWRVRITGADGRRRWIDLRFADERSAREYALQMVAQIAAPGVPTAEKTIDGVAGTRVDGSVGRWSSLLREHLKAAGVERHELYEDTGTERTKRVSFHSCRCTGIMWLVLSGASVTDVMRWAGHLSEAVVVRRYVRGAQTAQTKGDDSSGAFPPIPELRGETPVARSRKGPAGRKRRAKRSK